ncbi:MAG: DEAD/DEAH box helicase [Syntrophobacterales bacterium]|jgi:non-specific serine/threonine protein kinase|nr:DEAD/DEAH box helicase [Syntrophobacterales bacterium]
MEGAIEKRAMDMLNITLTLENKSSMIFTDPENTLLNAVKSLPPNTVYANVEKRTIFKGFLLYAGDKVENIEWVEGKGVLTVNVADGNGISVHISLEASKVLPRCSCKTYISQSSCEHTVCALLTIIHLLKPNIFKITVEDLEYREHLLAGLRKEPLGKSWGVSLRNRTGSSRLPFMKTAGQLEGVSAENVPLFKIILEGVSGRLKAYVERDGRRVDSTSNTELLPAELAYLVSFIRREDMSLPLSIFLRKWGKDYPVFFDDGNAVHRIDWYDNLVCTTWTEFDTSRTDILVRKGCSMAGDSRPSALIGNFAFNSDRTKMCYVKERHGWELWNSIRDLCRHDPCISTADKDVKDGVLRIPKHIFRKFYLSFSGLTEGGMGPSAVFKVKGVESEPVFPPVSDYRLMVSRHGDNGREFVIKPEFRVGGYSFEPSRGVLSFIRAVEWGRIPVSLRTKKRKPILYEMFFQALTLDQNRKALDETLKKAINERTFGKTKFASMARRLIREASAQTKTAEVRLHSAEQSWQFLTPDRAKELFLFYIPFQVFGSEIFERVILDDSMMIVKEEEFIGHLYSLDSLAKKHGIEVRVDDHPIESAEWEIEIDATKGTIDWFELKPEIRCNGLILDKEVWEKAILGRGVVYRNGVVQILDRKVLENLSAIACLGDTSGKAGKNSSAREIVSVPRLRIIELFMLQKRGISVRFTPLDKEIMSRLTQFDKIEKKLQPSGLKSELRQYQKEGYYWLSFLYEHRFGACLADDMGLGKTIQALALLGAIKERKVLATADDSNPSLVVMPPSLLFNWEKEIERFYSDLTVYVYRGKERSTILKGYDVVLTSYGLVRRDIEKLKNIHFNVIIFDEAQAIKNIFAGTTGAVRQLKGFFKVALTGTPVENHISEYFSIMDLVLPGLLGEYREFQRQARQEMGSFLPVVTERTRPFVLRRTKERILKDLPHKVEYDVYLELTERQKKLYNRTVEEVRSTIDEAYSSKTSSQARIIALTAIMKLRQICLSPDLLAHTHKELSPKIEFLVDKLEELGVESHSSLVFSQFTSFLDLVENELRAKDFRIFRLDGTTPVIKRKEIVEEFQACEGTSVFLLSLKAGGQGLNLTRAAYVFHLDPWWNPAVESQASSRSHRIGQKNKVIVTRLLMRHTVEEKMMALKQRKLSLYRVLMDAPERSSGKAITREDFNFLLGLD